MSFLGSCFSYGGERLVVCSCVDRSASMAAQRELEEHQRSLSSQKEMLEAIVSNMPGGLHVLDLGDPSKVLYLSDLLCSMTGYSRSEVKDTFGGRYVEMLHPDDRGLLLASLRDLREYPHTVTVSYRIVRKDRSVLYVTDTLRSVRDAHGGMRAYAIAMDDTSDELLLSGVSRASAHIPYPIACYDWSEQALSAVYCNEEFGSILNLAPAEYLALTARSPLSMVAEQSKRNIYRLLEQFEQGRNHAALDIVVDSGQGPQACTLVLNVISRCGSTFRALALLENDFYRHLGCIIRSDLDETARPKRVWVRTFGFFDVFVDGKAMPFRSAKAKELLALLVDRRGGFVSSSEAIGCLWEDEPANNVTRARCRKVAMLLLNELKEYGVADIVESSGNGSRRIVPERVGCDLFEYLAGKPEAAGSFKGAYLTNYSWGEFTLAELLASRGNGFDLFAD